MPVSAPPEAVHTFLFADLVGFTALAELEGDDRALEVVLGLQQRAWELLADHGGEQVKTIGDGLMLHCDDARAAINLGVRLVESLAAESDFPAVRVGIHTGPALANGGDWYGRTVNVAARLCAVAPGGEVMVSEEARRAADPVPGIEWGKRELHWLRNVSEPVVTYLAVATSNGTVPAAPRRLRFRMPSWRCGAAPAGVEAMA